jgi:hypothetical protein
MCDRLAVRPAAPHARNPGIAGPGNAEFTCNGHDPTARAVLLDAVRGLPWVLRNRRRVRPTIEEELASLERD